MTDWCSVSPIVLEKILKTGELDLETKKQLVALAAKAKLASYSPYSKFRVGAAVLATSVFLISSASLIVSSF
jgi:cytidine deaminase